jgi:hypothetical protein
MPSSDSGRQKVGGQPYVNSCGIVVRRGITCGDPLESTFFTLADPKSSMDPFYRAKAFGKASEGGVAPHGFCYACGTRENILVLERLDIIADGTPTVSPLCAACKARGIDFRSRKSTQTNLGRGAAALQQPAAVNWAVGMLCMARYKTSAGKTLLFPARVTGCGKAGEGPYDVSFFDGDDGKELPQSSLEPFVAVGSMVYAKWNSNTKDFFAGKITAVHEIGPKVSVDILYTDDEKVRKNCPLSQIYRPLRGSAFKLSTAKSGEIPSSKNTKGARTQPKAKRGIKGKRDED